MAQAFSNPLEINDFSKGITDDVYLQDYGRASVIDNFFITSDGKIKTRAGSIIDNDDPADDQIPAGVQRIGTLINYDNSTDIFVHSNKKIYYRDNLGAYQTLQGPTNNDLLSSGDLTNALSYTQWNKHIFLTSDDYPRPMKIYRDENGDYQLRTSGLPALATSPVVTKGAVGANDYLYAFHYEYTYIVNDQTFEDLGAVTEVALANSADPGTSNNAITAIPVISNGATDNWDTTVIKVFIFRTLAGGNVFYKIGEVTNGTTVFTDNVSDAALQTGALLYINDGTLDLDPTPEAKYVHVVNNTGYYGNISSADGTFPNRLQQSVPGDPDGCPGFFYVDLEDEIMGIGSIKSIPIVVCKRHIYRIENNFDQYGRGGINPVRISDTAGCVSNLSIVSAENGIIWAGNDGFYLSDGYTVQKVSDGFNETYKSILANIAYTNRIIGTFDDKERRVLWTIQQDSGSGDNDSLIELDLRWGLTDTSTFYTWSGNSFAPSAITFFNKKLYRADKRGYVLIHDDAYTTDPKIESSADSENWHRETIIWTYESVNMNFGGSYFRKVPAKILLTAANLANTTIQISAINDDGRITRELKPIRWRKNFVWGDPEFVWGNPECVWGGDGLIEQWRRFPSGGLRLSYLKLVITNGFSNIIGSDGYGTCSFNAAANTVVFDDISMSDWPDEIVDYYIYTEQDDYTEGFLITNRNSDDTITVADPNNSLPNGSLKWLVKGFKKDEPLHLLGYNIFWNDVSQTQATFRPAQEGNNA